MMLKDDIERLVTAMQFPARPEYRVAAREEMFRELDKVSRPACQPKWRAIMSSKPVRYATAFSVVAAVLAAVVILFGLTGGEHTVALAQVLEKVEAMSTVVLEEQRAFYVKGAAEPFLRGRAVKYVSSDLGQVELCWTDDGKPIYSAYFLKRENRVVVIFPAMTGYLELPLNGGLAALSDDVTPMGLVKLLTRHGYSALGRAERDGHQVDGFEVSRESIMAVLAAYQEYPEVEVLVPVKDAAARVWIDVDSSLPVVIEAELETGRGLFTGFQEGVVRFTAHGFRWDADIDPQLFVLDIPPDYKRLNRDSLKESRVFP